MKNNKRHSNHVVVYWADKSGSRAIPAGYALQIRKAGGGDVIDETSLDGPNPQILRIPHNVTEANIVLMNIVPQSQFGGRFQVTENINAQILSDTDDTSNYSTDRELAAVYIISTTDGYHI